MPIAPIQFKLKDADGVEHAYECLPHPASEGQRVMWMLWGMGVEPLGKIAAGFMRMEGMRGKSIFAAAGDASLREQFALVVDLGAMAAAIRQALASVPMDVLGKDLLSRTTRDGKELANPLVFDEAYSRNYPEYALALWEVVKANRFFPALSIS